MALTSFFLKGQREKRMVFRRNEKRLSIETYSVDYTESKIGKRCDDQQILFKLEFESTEENKAKVEEIASILWSKNKGELFETYDEAFAFIYRLVQAYFPNECAVLQV